MPFCESSRESVLGGHTQSSIGVSALGLARRTRTARVLRSPPLVSAPCPFVRVLCCPCQGERPFSIRCGTVSYPVAYLRVFDQYCVSILTCIITFWSALYTIPYHFVFKAYPSRIGNIYYGVRLVRRYRYGISNVSKVYPVSIPIRISQDVI